MDLDRRSADHYVVNVASWVDALVGQAEEGDPELTAPTADASPAELWHLLPHVLNAIELHGQLGVGWPIDRLQVAELLNQLRATLADDNEITRYLARRLQSHITRHERSPAVYEPDEARARTAIADTAIRHFGMAHEDGLHERPVPAGANTAAWFDLESAYSTALGDFATARAQAHLGRMVGTDRYDEALDFLYQVADDDHWVGKTVDESLHRFRTKDRKLPLGNAYLALSGTTSALQQLQMVLIDPATNSHARETAYEDLKQLLEAIELVADPVTAAHLETWNRHRYDVTDRQPEWAPTTAQARALFDDQSDTASFDNLVQAIEDHSWKNGLVAGASISRFIAGPNIIAVPAARAEWTAALASATSNAERAALARMLRQASKLPLQVRGAMLGDMLADAALADVGADHTPNVADRVLRTELEDLCEAFTNQARGYGGQQWQEVHPRLSALHDTLRQGAQDPQWSQRLADVSAFLIDTSEQVLNQERFTHLQKVRSELAHLDAPVQPNQVATQLRSLAALFELNGSTNLPPAFYRQVADTAMFALGCTAATPDPQLTQQLAALQQVQPDEPVAAQATEQAAATLREHYGLKTRPA